jgi:hypothetical protein
LARRSAAHYLEGKRKALFNINAFCRYRLGRNCDKIIFSWPHILEKLKR